VSDNEPKKKGFLSRWLGGTSEPAPETKPPAEEETPPAETSEPAGADPAPPQTADVEPAAPPAAPQRKGWFERLKAGLSKTSSRLTESITGLVTKRKLDQDTLDELEEVLLAADLGIETAERITAAIAKGRFDKTIDAGEVREILADEVARVLEPVAKPLAIDPARKPHVVLVLGVNGSGKTTTIGKLAAKFTREGRRVMLAAGDTFRAAAIDQLKVWGERTGVPVLAREVGSDASGLAFDAVKQAQDGGYDILLIDTAGRLQNKEGLMAELEKVVRVIRKVDPTAPHDVLLVLDATTGQNAMQQVEVFRERAGVTGLVMTKLDGTARGGILVAIAARHGLPVHAVGVGEGVDDLQSFSAKDYARAIAEI
jgi:fused signal recognition particle receptor